jgi:hypothetical protein
MGNEKLSQHGSSGVGGVSLGIKRINSNVEMTLGCHDEYAAIEVYERLIEAAKDGLLKIDLKTQ